MAGAPVWWADLTTRRNLEFSLSMIHVLWHDSMRISSTRPLSHAFEEIRSQSLCRLGDSCHPHSRLCPRGTPQVRIKPPLTWSIEVGHLGRYQYLHRRPPARLGSDLQASAHQSGALTHAGKAEGVTVLRTDLVILVESDAIVFDQ